MKILTEKTTLQSLQAEEMFFDYMTKAVVDIDQERIAVNAELHSDLEQLLLDTGSDQHFLYGINLLFEEREIEFDSMINPPRNREAGYPRVGRDVADPAAKKKISEVVEKWIEM